MKLAVPMVILLAGLPGCTGGAPAEPPGLRAELSMKDEKISALEAVIARQRERIESLTLKERDAQTMEAELTLRELRILDLQEELDRLGTLLAKNEAALQIFARQFQAQLGEFADIHRKNEDLRARVAQLEKDGK